MKKILIVCCALALLTGCSAGSTNVPDTAVFQAVQTACKDSTQENVSSMLSLIFDETQNKTDRKFKLTKENNGTKINFLNADELVQMDSTSVTDYTDVLNYYLDTSALYRTEQVADETFQASYTKDEVAKVLTAHDYSGDWEVISINETAAAPVGQQAAYVLQMPLNIEPLLQQTLYLCPLNNAQYYKWKLSEVENGWQIAITIADKKEFTADNKKKMGAHGYQTGFFDVFDIEEDSYTLTLDENGALTAATHSFLAKYVIDGIERQEQMESSTSITPLQQFNTEWLDSLFAKEYKEGQILDLSQLEAK